MIGTISIEPDMTIEFEYHNHQGHYSTRRVLVLTFEFGATEWHPEQQMFLFGMCLQKNSVRTFAIKDMYNVRIAGELK